MASSLIGTLSIFKMRLYNEEEYNIVFVAYLNCNAYFKIAYIMKNEKKENWN